MTLRAQGWGIYSDVLHGKAWRLPDPLRAAVTPYVHA